MRGKERECLTFWDLCKILGDKLAPFLCFLSVGIFNLSLQQIYVPNDISLPCLTINGATILRRHHLFTTVCNYVYILGTDDFCIM